MFNRDSARAAVDIDFIVPLIFSNASLFEYMLNYPLCESILTYESQAGQRKKCSRQDSPLRAGRPSHQLQPRMINHNP
jgi:hypothetical protein